MKFPLVPMGFSGALIGSEKVEELLLVLIAFIRIPPDDINVV